MQSGVLTLLFFGLCFGCIASELASCLIHAWGMFVLEWAQELVTKALQAMPGNAKQLLQSLLQHAHKMQQTSVHVRKTLPENAASVVLPDQRCSNSIKDSLWLWGALATFQLPVQPLSQPGSS